MKHYKRYLNNIGLFFIVVKMYDLVILGGGSAGFHAAMTALKFKKKVCVIEKGPFGGLCILNGCMPSKTLLYSARLAELFKKSHKLGVYNDGKIKIDMGYMIARKNKIIHGFASARKEFLEGQKNLDVVYGGAEFVDKKAVRVGEKLIEGKYFLIATGSKIFIPDVPGLKETGFITSDDALELKKLPESIAVIGGGAVGVELAYYFYGLGSKVILLQRGEQLLNGVDKDIAKELERIFVEKGIKVYKNTSLKNFSLRNGKKQITFEHGKSELQINVDELLIATGRKPNIDSLQLYKAGVKVDKGNIIVNDYLQTSNKNVYAAGDVSGKMPVVNVAVEEGRIAASNMFEKKKEKLDYLMVPAAVFSHPEIAWTGLNEEEAKMKYKNNVLIGKLPYSELGKAECYDETDGFIKFIVERKSKRILGVGIIGHEASDIIHEALPLLHFKATLYDLKKMLHIHPTFGEIFAYLCDEMLS